MNKSKVENVEIQFLALELWQICVITLLKPTFSIISHWWSLNIIKYMLINNVLSSGEKYIWWSLPPL